MIEVHLIYSLSEGESYSRPFDSVYFQRVNGGISVIDTEANQEVEFISDAMPIAEAENRINKILNTF